MKKAFFIVVCAVMVLGTVSARGVSEYLGQPDGVPDLGYAFGVWIGSEFKDSGLKLNYRSVAYGLQQAMEGTATLSADEAVAVVQAAYAEAIEQSLAEYRERENKYLTENAAKSGIRTTSSGLQYEVITEATGRKPGIENTVEVHYEGRLTDGTVFDSSYQREETVSFPLFQVIPGWAEGLQLMSVGATYRFYIPSNLAYGEQGFDPVIPPYSTLIFVVELFRVVD